ncbi:MAG: hypothetical protein ACRDRX_21195 [Pseudonocardiaceae bacterium]
MDDLVGGAAGLRSVDGEVRVWDPATGAAPTSLRVASGLFASY